ncbi:tRNA (guanosine(18)-2'-O)-methyltransferase TrmH [Synechococcus sp. M16CYN]
MADLTVLLEHVEKPHNLSAILRSCDAVGALEAHAVNLDGRPLRTYNSTAQGSQKWVPLNDHPDIETAVSVLRNKGFQLFGTYLGMDAKDYRDCDFTGPTAFVFGAEKWGLSHRARDLMDEILFIPMRGMVQSLNVSVATSTLLFESLRQRQIMGIAPTQGEGLQPNHYQRLLLEWSYPEVAAWCREQNKPYPALNEAGELMEELPRTVKLRY